jgi:diphosphomevalonate decarboxylase
MIVAKAIAHANIALAKYWGKADVAANLPAVPSVSMTLDAMSTETVVCFDPSLDADVLELNGVAAPAKALKRASLLLDRVRAEANLKHAAKVVSANNFPTASGLASSASGFAALAIAARAAAGLPRDVERESSLARQSSASAARSVYGGYVALDLGSLAARRIASADSFPLELTVAVISEGPKGVGSTDGMEHTRTTSPYYQAWVDHAPQHAANIERAISSADFDALGPLVEQSALLMHASMFGARRQPGHRVLSTRNPRRLGPRAALARRGHRRVLHHGRGAPRQSDLTPRTRSGRARGTATDRGRLAHAQLQARP